MGALWCADRAPDLCESQEEELVAGETQGGQYLLSSVLLYPVLVRPVGCLESPVVRDVLPEGVPP
ncbi:hypothetical protein OFC10_35000, partial [Escherichia coli]|nr:hypothetical protein [Escherichia coli]